MKLSNPCHTGFASATLLIALLLIALPVGVWGLNQAELTAKLDQMVGSPLVNGADIAIAVFDPADSSEIYAYRSKAALIPASVTKLFTSAAALTELHPDFRFQTQIGYRGEIQSGALTGDLIIKAGGDPSWAAEIFPEGAHQVFEIWADSLAAHGISSISGNIVVDTSLYPTQLFSTYWSPHDKARGYAPPISPLSFNKNALDLEVTGARASGRPATVMEKHGYGYMSLDNRVKTSARDRRARVSYQRATAPRAIAITGSVPVNASVTLAPSIDDPLAFCVQIMTETFRKRGISLSGAYLAENTSIDPPFLLFTYSSVALQDINQVMMKKSCNFIAEMLYHYLGKGEAGTARPISELCEAIGIQSPALKIVDGSGLSRQNQISPADLGKLLCHSYHQEWFDSFLQALPVSGMDGTLKKRFATAASQARVFAKSGGMTGISNLAGYFEGRDGQLYAFVIFGNDFSKAANGRKWAESICDQLILFEGTKD
ncbi:MAG: D-alanyl-D-alanine carboxypeptidase/D-alanyl-D-alanine-endopeptidase [Candidatus Cloacimonetes bacterium]|nr:D-alanyl-D-alanine carboxypeptidase/D-alanyl-D-alanine-endopeptidase [Candidatus Cloacimonadota bacterium]MCK9185374.1 D-alanyl-D-alanine carboxypeptidase/D-alanyl-D-alanine-endopeptidase [Candidatus Cloacimonadota bacterium]